MEELAVRLPGRADQITWQKRSFTARVIGDVTGRDLDEEETLRRKHDTLLRRVAALIIDTLLFVPLGIVLMIVFVSRVSRGGVDATAEGIRLMAIVNILLALAPILYRIIMHGVYGATVGKYAMKLTVTNLSGGALGFRGAIRREIF